MFMEIILTGAVSRNNINAEFDTFPCKRCQVDIFLEHRTKNTSLGFKSQGREHKL